MSNKTVIKLKNLPHGYNEEQLTKYLTQFGHVNNVELRFVKAKSGKQILIGYVEFKSPKAAKVAAKTMNNSKFLDNILKSQQMDKTELPENVFNKVKRSSNLNVSFTKSNSTRKVSLYDRHEFKTLNDHYRKIVRIQHLLSKLGVDLECHFINSNFTSN